LLRSMEYTDSILPLPSSGWTSEMLVRPAATALGRAFCAEVNVTGPLFTTLVKCQLRSEPFLTRVRLPVFWMYLMSTSRFVSGAAKIVLEPSRPGNLPPPLAR